MFCFCKKKEPIYFNDYLKNNIFNIEVIDVYDGDTITGIIPINNNKFIFKCRMYGYDSPEKKPLLSNEDRINEIYCSNISKFILSKLCLNKTLKCKSYGFDKYGRILVLLYNENNKSINNYMVDNYLGYIYNGKKKPKIIYLQNGEYILENKKYKINDSFINEFEKSFN